MPPPIPMAVLCNVIREIKLIIVTLPSILKKKFPMVQKKKEMKSQVKS